jgi:hypothetical protein
MERELVLTGVRVMPRLVVGRRWNFRQIVSLGAKCDGNASKRVQFSADRKTRDVQLSRYSELNCELNSGLSLSPHLPLPAASTEAETYPTVSSLQVAA